MADTLTETPPTSTPPQNQQTNPTGGTAQTGAQSQGGAHVQGEAHMGSTQGGASVSGSLDAGGQSAGGQSAGGQSAGGQSGQQNMPSRSQGGGGWSFEIPNPFGLMRSFADEMDSLFESFGFPSSRRSRSWSNQGAQGAGLERQGGGGGMGMGTSRSFWAPQVEVSRRGNDLVVCADLPGMKKEDIHIEIRDDQLILQGERRQESTEDREGFYRSERSYGRFYRTVPLPQGTNPDQTRANFKDGVLEITLPLPEQASRSGRKIEIG
jgi:HSP20 family protein